MPLLAYNRNNYTDLNGTSNDFEDGLVVNGMLATSLALLLSLMTLFAVGLRWCLQVSTIWRIMFHCFGQFSRSFHVACLNPSHAGGRPWLSADRRQRLPVWSGCKGDSGRRLCLGAPVQGDGVVGNLLSVHASHLRSVHPGPGPTKVGLWRWIGAEPWTPRSDVGKPLRHRPDETANTRRVTWCTSITLCPHFVGGESLRCNLSCFMDEFRSYNHVTTTNCHVSVLSWWQITKLAVSSQQVKCSFANRNQIIFVLNTNRFELHFTGCSITKTNFATFVRLL